MSSKAARLRAYNQQIVDEAARGLPRNPDGSLIEGHLRAALARILREKVNLDVIADQRAAAVIDTLTKQAGEDDDEASDALQLSLFGESYGYNPQRLIKDSDGNIVEEDRATLPFILAELSRSSEHVRRASLWNSRKARKAEHFQKWVAGELNRGRTAIDLTWGNCIRETGVLRG